MRCKCGYVLSCVGRGFDSHVVVADRDYPAFLKSERRVLAAKTQAAKLRAIARSSELSGLLLECPQCARLLFLKPGTAELIFLQREK